MSSAFRKPILIYNPTAGKLKRNQSRVLHEVVAALREAGIEPELTPTTGPGVAGKMAAKAIAEGADLIIGLGGDGTINEIASGMIGTRTPLAVLPGGTANVFSIETGVGRNAVRAARKMGERVAHRIAVGRVVADGGTGTPRHFLAMTGAGLDARIVNEVNPRLKRATGKFAYWVAGLAQFIRPLHTVSTADGERFGFVLASRVRNYGGDLEIARKASLLRDEFEVVTFDGINPLRYVFYFTGVLLRLHSMFPGVRMSPATQLEFTKPGAFVQVDGELLGMTPASVNIVPDALTVLLPPAFKG